MKSFPFFNNYTIAGKKLKTLAPLPNWNVNLSESSSDDDDADAEGDNGQANQRPVSRKPDK